jgi:rubredoxin---NAD+ reductase
VTHRVPGDSPLVIVGAGLAGYGALRALRRLDQDLEISLVTEDGGAAWARTQLPSHLAAGSEASALIQATAEVMAQRLNTSILVDTRVARIDRERGVLETARGDIPYARLVLATGAAALRPSGVRGSAVERVLTLSTLADYRYFRHQLAGRHRVAILGGTVAGCEFADNLARAGCRVSLFEPGGRLLGEQLPPLSAARLAQGLSSAGVGVHIEDGIVRIDRAIDELVLTTLSGKQMAADVVLAASGTRPRASIAREAGLDVGRGVRVDASLRTSDPAIFALGECAEIAGRRFVRHEDIEAASIVLASVLCGRHGVMSWRSRLHHLQIEACRVVMCEPPAVSGEWQETATPHGVTALFHDLRGDLRGFILVGDASHQAVHFFARLGH